MAKTKFELNLPGLNELMKSPEMTGILNDAAQKIASAAGPGYEVEAAHPISFVGIAAVHARSAKARRDCLETNALIKTAGSVKI